MKEKHINSTPLSSVFEHMLIAYIGEAFAKFQKELLYLFY